MINHQSAMTLFVALHLSLVGCNAGSGEGLDENGNPVNDPSDIVEENNGSDDVSNSSLEPTLESIQEKIFTPICAKCHKTGSPPQGLNLDSQENAFALLVDKEANEVPGLKRVAPGEPENSYLIQKLEGTASVGARMPLGGTPIADEDISVIKLWIESLAPNVSSASTRAAKTLHTGSTPVDKNEICFDKAINTTTVYSSALSIVGVGDDSDYYSDNTFTLVPDFDYQITQVSAACLHIDFAESVTSGVYLMQLNHRNGTPLLDVDGFMIDGNQDGSEGGSLSLTMNILEGEIQ